MKALYLGLKRGLDLISACLLLITFMPLMAMVSALLLAIQGPPILFRQRRPGLNGKEFRILKFRTMTLEQNEGVAPRGDEAVTPLGFFLRRTSIDELPQLINIVKGEMSFVGPRPLLVEYLPLYSTRQAARHSVRPGLTGLAQVNGRNLLGLEAKIELDLLYTEKISLILDLYILAKSLLVAISGKGADVR